MMEDNVAVVQVHSWPLLGSVFDGQVAKGPVPVFFSEDVEMATKGLNEDTKSVLRWHTRTMDRGDNLVLAPIL